jgi:peptide/nickel transport system substrate-binding protein
MKGIRLILIVAVMALVAAGCEGAGEEPQPGTTGPGTTGPGTTGSPAAVDTTFTYSAYSEILTDWDPATEYSNEVIAFHNIYETLTRYNAETQEVEPLLAESWSASEDALTWTFTLREGVTFHTGRPMTADAVKAAIERTLELGAGAAYIWSAVESIEAPDDRTVVFNLSYASPIDLVASGTYAAYVYDTEAAGDQDLNEWFQEGNEAGTGPYMVESWEPGEEFELRLVAYPDYWRGWDGAHYDRLEFRVTPEATTAAQLLESGQVDYVQRMTPQLWSTFEGKDGFVTSAASSWQTLFALLNTTDGPLADLNVRLGVAYGIDYEGIMAALQGAAETLSGHVPPGLWGHSDELPNYTYDTGKAKEYLGKAGYGPEGEPLSLELIYTKGDADEELVATLMKSNLADLNIDLDVRGLQWQAQWDKAKSADPTERQDIFVFYWWPDYPDPISWFFNLFRTEEAPFFNLAYYSNPTIDQQMDEAASLSATERDEAIAMYEDMQATLLEDAPAIPLYNQVYQRAMLSSVGGYVDNPSYPSVVFVYDLVPQG